MQGQTKLCLPLNNTFDFPMHLLKGKNELTCIIKSLVLLLVQIFYYHVQTSLCHIYHFQGLHNLIIFFVLEKMC